MEPMGRMDAETIASAKTSKGWVQQGGKVKQGVKSSRGGMDGWIGRIGRQTVGQQQEGE